MPARSGARPIPQASAARLSRYLQVLGDLTTRTVSSADLARRAGVTSATLRKDLSFVGPCGTPGVGYEVEALIGQVSQVLGVHRRYRVALAGVGHLGQALAGYPGFTGRGLTIAALFDADPERIGGTVAGLQVHDIADVATVCRAADVAIGVIATPAGAAQQVAEALVDAGIRSILNFAPAALDLPADVQVRRVDLALELQMLAFHETHREPAGSAGGAVVVRR
ncbi:redox-sensing transcriptional repressor Rex [Nakamurella sp. YIM 132084]|uniref:Redox-sensing transcriptional repressor Rex n=1 Tax=Nakamurella leprariae TaxID=2803911 RepID=A0A939BY64_9ACTN|nr:redox-sensing transcriptional repressor Rex [Nakamurella leprariae]